jgi:HTH-type transcriptional regulator / antitoxin HipB
MNYKEYFNKQEENAEYQKVEQDLKTLLDLADDVLRLRMEKGWSQVELATRAGTKQANISRLESGLSNPSVNFLRKIAKALSSTVVIRFEKISASQININTDAENQSFYVPNWPLGETYKHYRSSSIVEKL